MLCFVTVTSVRGGETYQVHVTSEKILHGNKHLTQNFGKLTW